ncbi:alpha/beta hydrolase [Stakelama saccharophila]|uniref:Alpha/beta hydrolase n=1 Tax=Stakelama saccharophila TaxID=3075605 RepID=A0ABZ0B7E6_9SPHN|nr:alpha/beta hydrolase [Stakelama sp. W311]WNO52793.1 alpha/beta hydrolase [Stakelama sp. W311]
MTIDRRTLIGGALALSFAGTARAQEWGEPTPAAGAADRPEWPPREHFALWPGTAPGTPATLPEPHNTMNGPAGDRQLWLYGIPEAFVSVYRPAQPNGRGLLSIPGGGYGFVSVQNEGIDVAQEYARRGYTVFVLTYRLPGEGWAQRWDVPLQDAQRAMRLIRARADTWNIDPDTLGIVGFSAGGHLAASLATSYDASVYDRVDGDDARSAKPAFAGLIYPVINLSIDKSNSSQNLLGPQPPADAVARYDTANRVTAETPPVFLVQAMDDGLVNPDNTLAMVEAARAAKVPVEAHLFEEGGHGFGIRHLPEGAPATLWPELFALWIARHVTG